MPQRLRWLYRAPIGFYRAGLAGWLRYVGAEWILLTTRGRRTGKPHSVLVDLLAYDEVSGTFYVQSAYGRASDWVRNLESDRRLVVRFRGCDLEARARILSSAEATEVIGGYVATHRVYARLVAWLLGYRGRIASGADLRNWLAGTFTTLAIDSLEHPRDT